MLANFRNAGLVWPTLLAIPALALLIGLGNWQMSRKTWKEGLVTQIEARTKAAPRSITIDKSAAATVEEYTRVEVVGRFEHAREQYFYAPDGRLGPGYHVYAPLVAIRGSGTSDTSSHQLCVPFVLVNRGFVPEPLKAPDKRAEGQILAAAGVKVIGLARHPEKPGAFTPANEPAKRLWYWRDLRSMAEAMQADDKRCGTAGLALPFSIDAEAEPANPGGWPRGGTTNLTIPNRHLEYALTWYALAATLVGVLLAFAAGRLRAARD